MGRQVHPCVTLVVLHPFLTSLCAALKRLVGFEPEPKERDGDGSASFLPLSSVSETDLSYFPLVLPALHISASSFRPHRLLSWVRAGSEFAAQIRTSSTRA